MTASPSVTSNGGSMFTSTAGGDHARTSAISRRNHANHAPGEGKELGDRNLAVVVAHFHVGQGVFQGGIERELSRVNHAAHHRRGHRFGAGGEGESVLQRNLVVLSDTPDACDPLGHDAAATDRRGRDARPSLPTDSPGLASMLAGLGEVLLVARKFPEAEGALRESLAIREKKTPDDYRTFDTKSKLGGALLGQKKYTDAKPLLLKGYEGMKQQEARIPPKDRFRLPEAVERLVQLYEALGKKEDVAKWRKEQEAIKTSPAQPDKMPRKHSL